MKTLRTGVLVIVAGGISPALPAQDMAESCVACHKGPLTLESWDAAELAERLRDIRDGRSNHVVPLPPLGDEDLEALASALAGS